MTVTACDTETCDRCEQPAPEGLNAAGECVTCETGGTLAHNLRLMAAGVTRDRATGRYTQVRKPRARACGVCGQPEGGDPAYARPCCTVDNMVLL